MRVTKVEVTDTPITREIVFIPLVSPFLPNDFLHYENRNLYNSDFHDSVVGSPVQSDRHLCVLSLTYDLCL